MTFILELVMVENFGGGLFCHLRLYLSLVTYDTFKKLDVLLLILVLYFILAGGAIRVSNIYFSRERQYKYSFMSDSCKY